MAGKGSASREGASEPAAPSGGGWGAWIAFNATVFMAAACIMTVEILSTRLVARYLGSSLYTWTSAIGVVLAGISLGNYIGGRLADRYHPRRTLSVLFLAASLACVTIPMVNGWIGTWSALDGMSWPTRIFLHFIMVFLLPATMLGTMSPVVAKMALDMGRGAGRTVGTIYAWGSIGSIVGTFAAGYYLVAEMGTERAILLVSGVLAVMAIIYGYRSWFPYAWGAVCLFLMVSVSGSWSWSEPMARALGMIGPDDDRLVFKQDSQYQRVMVMDTGGTERTMVLDSLVHSRIDLADPLDLRYGYEMIYAAVMKAAHPEGQPVSGLVLGGGGYVFPRYIELAYPGSHVEVAEIDPIVTQAAYEVFGLPADTNIVAHDLDARNLVEDQVRAFNAGTPVAAYDFIFGDSFHDFSVPFHLTTVEFTRHLSTLMTSDGVYMLNLIDMYQSGRFVGSILNTLREVFPHVYAFTTDPLSAERSTFVAIGSKRPLELESVMESLPRTDELNGLLLDETHYADLTRRTGGMVLTDDYAPVENLLAPVVKAYTRSSETETPETITQQLGDLLRNGRYAEVIERAQRVLDADPSAPDMHYAIGRALEGQGAFDEALAALRAERAIDPERLSVTLAMADVYEKMERYADAEREYLAALESDPARVATHCDLGRALLAADRVDDAVERFREAVRVRPGFVRAQVGLGNALVRADDVVGALGAYETALRLDATFPGLRHDYAVALARVGRATDAITELRFGLEADPEDAALHNQLGRMLVSSNDLEGAINHFSQAAALDQSNAGYRANLGLACEQMGRFADAVVQYEASLRINDQNPALLNALARLLASSSDDAVRDGAAAVRWAEALIDQIGRGNPDGLDTLAMAYAEAGRFDDAVRTATEAARVADRASMRDLARVIRTRLALYESGRAYRAR